MNRADPPLPTPLLPGFFAAALVLAAGAAPAAAQATVAWWDTDPLVLDLAAPAVVTLTVAIDGEADEVRLDLADGGSQQLVPSGGVWTTAVPGAVAVAGYGTGEKQYNQAYHNHLGTLKVIHEAVELHSYNVFVNVRDATVPPVTVTSLARGAQSSPHLLNLRFDDADPAAPPFAEAIARAVELLGDHFDLFAVITLPQRFANRVHVRLRAPETGIGEPVNDTSAAHGTARGLGFTEFPIAAVFDGGSTGFVHELGHQWIQWLDDVEALQGAKFHWPLSTLAQSLMGVSGPASQSWQGIEFPYRLVPLANGGWKVEAAPRWTAFHDLDLYLMGLAPAAEVGTHTVFRQQDQEVHHGALLAGATEQVSVGEVIAAYGPRFPAYPEAPRAFTHAAIVVSKARLLTVTEMALFDHLAARAAAEEELVTSGGLVATTDLPFRLATGGSGCLVVQLSFHAPRLEAPAAAGSGGTYLVTWSPTSQAGTYEVQEAADATFATAATIAVTGTTRAFTHTSSGVATSFFYRLRAVDHCTGALRSSAWSAGVEVTVGPQPAHVPHLKLPRRR